MEKMPNEQNTQCDKMTRNASKSLIDKMPNGQNA